MNSRIDAPASPCVPIAIVGMACAFPKAPDLESFWANVRDGVSGIGPVPATHWRPEDYFDPDPSRPDRTYADRGGFIDPVDFDPLAFGISPKALESTDTTQLLGMVVAGRALEDAGYHDEARAFDRDRASVILGVTGALPMVIPLGARLGRPLWRRALHACGVDEQTADAVVERIARSYLPWTESSFPGLLGNVAAGRIAQRLDLHGTNCVVDAACASSLSALHLALLELQTGRSDLVLAGGLDTFNDPFMYTCFSKTPALSPSGVARPFDAEADGTILGEGLGVLALKRLTDAEQDGDRVYAVIKGIGSSSDGKGKAIYAPDAVGQARALRRAHQAAGVGAETLELVEAHGTGTKVGDTTELEGLTTVFRESRPEGTWCSLGSVKSMIGHTKAAAGAAGIIKAALALRHRVLPPTLEVRRPHPRLEGSPFTVSTVARPWVSEGHHPRRAGVSAFGFGGSNFHCVLEEYEPSPVPVDWDGRVQLLAWSGRNIDELSASVRTSIETLGAPGRFASMLRDEGAATRARFDPQAPVRITAVLTAHPDEEPGPAVSRLHRVLERLRTDSPASWSTPDGVAFGTGPASGGLGLVFVGQGAQSPGMLRALACRFRSVQAVLDDAERICPGLRERLYPPTAFDSEAETRQVEALRDTAWAQPALGAVELGGWSVLRHFGIEPQAAVGHSYGELAALCAAGRITPEQLHHLSVRRGALMAGDGRDRGSMLAVATDARTLRAHLEHSHLQVAIANDNGPRQQVVSGPTDDIAQAEALLTEAGLRCRRLSVSAAFHSPLVADACEPFARELASVEFGPGRFDVYANTSGVPYPADPPSARRLLAEQLRAPVRFAECIEAMFDAGIRTFVEVGPGRKLSSAIRSITRDGAEVLAINPSSGPSSGASSGRHDGMVDLARLLGALVARGLTVDLSAWDAGYQSAPPSNRWTVPVCGANPEPSTARDDSPTPPSTPMPNASDASSTPRLVPAQPLRSSPGSTPATTEVSGAPNSTLDEHLRALIALQARTTEVHERFLEQQAEATRALTSLLAGTPPSAARPVPRSAALASSPTPDDFPRSASARPPAAPHRKAASAPLPSTRKPTDVAAMDRTVSSPPTAVSTVPDDGALARLVLQIVADKTGYPQDMLELGMSLDADLGIDSIKRVEILSALAEALPGRPPVAPEDMASIQTVADIVSKLGSDGGANLPSVSVDAPAPRASQPSSDLVAVVLSIIGEKTGYPADMLEPQMSLDADLGIDSIKRVEILSALAERLPSAPTLGPEQLGELLTIGDIVDRLSTGAPEATPADAPRPSRPAQADDDLLDLLRRIVADKTGYPPEMLELSMHLDADLGIDSIKRVEIFSALAEARSGMPAPAPERLGDVQTLADVLRVIGATPSADERPTASPVEERETASAAVDGDEDDGITAWRWRWVEWEGSGTASPMPGALALVGGTTALRDALCRAFQSQGIEARPAEDGPGSHGSFGGVLLLPTASPDLAALERRLAELQALWPRLDAHAWLGALTTLGGRFGLDGVRDRAAAYSAGLGGLVKALGWERPQARVRVIDVDPVRLEEERDELAAAVARAFALEGPQELGIHRAGLGTRRLEPDALEQSSPTWHEDDVLLVSGGARGVTASVAAALAQSGAPNLVLLGRSEPVDEPAWLTDARSDADLKQQLAEHLEPRPSMSELAQRSREILASRSIRDTLRRLEDAGARVTYRAVDVRDTAAVRDAVRTIESDWGPITGLVHGAGVLADRRLEDKSAEDFGAVLGTKVAGFENLLEALDPEALRHVVVFSSSSGVFGRPGQCDYAAANALVDALAVHWRTRRPSCRVLSPAWGPWAGGMVHPALEAMFRAEGLVPIALQAGAKWLTQALASDGPVERVVLGSGSSLPGRGDDEPSRAPTPAAVRLPPVVFTRRIDLESHPVLRDHVIGGRAVLPTVLMVEWLAHAALHGNLGLQFAGFDDLRVLRGVPVANPQTLELRAGPSEVDAEGHSVSVWLTSSAPDGSPIRHAAARIRLGATSPTPPEARLQRARGMPTPEAASLYGAPLFHGPRLQTLGSIEGLGPDGIVARVEPAAAPTQWMDAPLRRRWLAEPGLLDGGMQALIAWSWTLRGQVSLPAEITSYRQYRTKLGPEPATLVAVVTSDSNHHATSDWELLDEHGSVLATVTGYRCTLDDALTEAFARNAVHVAEDRRVASATP